MKPEHLAQLSADVPVPKDAELLELTRLCERQVQLEERIGQVEALLAELQQEHRDLAERELPTKLAQLGLVSLTLTNGSKVVLKPFMNASIVKENEGEAHAWLEKHGFADLIKHVLTLSFTKGEAEMAKRAQASLMGAGFVPDDKIAVHPQTLRAFVREQLAQGRPLPADLFSVYIGQRATIERSK